MIKVTNGGLPVDKPTVVPTSTTVGLTMPSGLSSKPVANESRPTPTLPTEDAIPRNVGDDVASSNPAQETEEPAPQETFVVDKQGKKVYVGDVDRNTEEPPEGGYRKLDTLQFESALELVSLFDVSVRTGKADDEPFALHAWQTEVLDELSFAKPTSRNPYRFALRAANGSGKDSYITAPFVVWFALSKVRALTIVTSSSGVQLTAQTESYIAHLCRTINAYCLEHGISSTPIFKVNRRFIKCLTTGSEIRLFATDEAGKAEGYHPLQPGAEMLIVINEAKSVAPEIFGALERCTGYNYWLNISTPGEPIGDFYESCNSPFYKHRKVSAYDCTHLSIDHIRMMEFKHGPNSFIFRSTVLAEFTTIGGNTVIAEIYADRCIDNSRKNLIPYIAENTFTLSADLAAGRDECSFWARCGNKIIDQLHFIERDTTETEEKFYQFWLKHGGNEKCHTIMDDGGLGHAIIDRLVKRGVRIQRVLNQSRAINATQFGNRGAEMWYNLARLIEECVIQLNIDKLHNKDHEKLFKQLTLRHYKKQETQGRITLLSKKEEKEEYKLSSPDRADALVLVFSNYRFDDFVADRAKKFAEKPAGQTIEEIMNEKFTNMRRAFTQDGTQNASSETSIECILAQQRN